MKRIFPFAMCAVLAGCSTFPGDAPVDDGASVQQSPNVISDEFDPTGRNDAARDGASSRRRLGSVPRPKRKPAGIRGMRPDLLVGKTPQEIEALIGRPAALADRPPATVWLYRTDTCALELFFYMDVGTKTFRTLTFVMTNPDGSSTSPSRCLGQIRAVAYGS